MAAITNEEDWPLRGTSCFGDPPPPNSGQTLNPDVRVEHPRSSLIYGTVSTTDALASIVQHTKNAAEEYVAAIFFDISGAFDTVWRPHVLKTLCDAGVPGDLFKITYLLCWHYKTWSPTAAVLPPTPIQGRVRV